MALVAKITRVGYLQQVNENGTTTTDDLSLRGRYFVEVDYYDSGTPNDVLLEHVFEFPQETTVEDAQAAIVAYGQKVRDARVRVNELTQFVGAVIPLS